ncbi:MAG: hypothetical protein IJM17_09955 [Firmicutes bacterium]|nr:hypothetical protein [Bacillota bacterium]
MNKALFKENIKRFWTISAVASLVYFMCGPFVLLSRENASVFTAREMLCNFNFGFLLLNCAVPVVLCVSVFSYLYRMNSAGVMHSLPFSRTTLFVTNFVSGLCLSWAPLALNALVMLVMKLGNVLSFKDISAEMTNSGSVLSWSVQGILLWLVISMLEMFFIFAVSSMGAVISGNTVISLLTCCALNLVIQACILAHYAYCCVYLYGFNENQASWLNVGRLHPVTYYIMNNIQELRQAGSPGAIKLALSALAFVAAAALIAVLAWKVYQRRPNEKTGDSYVFNSMSFIIGLLLVFLGTSAVGLLFNDSFGLWGYIVSGLCCFIVAQMIVRKTPRIFDGGIVKPLVASVIMMALVLGCYIFDVTGFENRVPKVSDVKSVTLQNYSYNFGAPYVMDDEEGIALAAELHRQVVANKEKYKKWETSDGKDLFADDYDGQGWRYLDIEYTLKNGRKVTREFRIPGRELQDSEALKAMVMGRRSAVFEGLEARSRDADIRGSFFVYDWEYKDGTEPPASVKEVLNEENSAKVDKALTYASQEQKLELLRAIREDYEALPYEVLSDSASRYTWYYLDLDIRHGSMDQKLYDELSGLQSRIYYIWHTEKSIHEPESYVEKVNIELNANWPRTLEVLQKLACQ